jgi:hypothetical protein
VKYALRSLWRDRIVPATVILTVGLALAANTALFSVFDGLLFRPLRYRDATSIVHVRLAAHLTLPDHRRDRQALIEHLESSPLLIERADADPAQSSQVFNRADSGADGRIQLFLDSILCFAC